MGRIDPETSTLDSLPLFPLTGMLLLPGTFMPLNVFEQRYRNLVADVVEKDGLIGMIQPLIPAPDVFGPGQDASSTPDIYEVGCAGKIEEWQRESDGRYLIVLRGRSRFRTLEELPLHRGYRRVRARLLDEADERHEGDQRLAEKILPAALDYCRRYEIGVDADVLEALPGWRLVNSLAAALPFRPEEKQALLEAQTVWSRGEALIQLLEMSRGMTEPLQPFEPAAPN